MMDIFYLFKKQYIVFGCFIAFIATNNCLYGQSHEFSFKRLTVQNGLSQNNVTGIVRDKKGFLWLTTRDGLNKYDGNKFTIYNYSKQDSNSISSNYLNVLYEDREGNIWIGNSEGLNRYNAPLNNFTRFSLGKTSVFVKSIFQDSKGNMWIGAKKGFFAFNPHTAQYKVYFADTSNVHSISHNDVNFITEINKGEIWIGTNGGLNIFYPATEKFVSFKHDPNDPYSITDDRVKNIQRDFKGRIWITTQGGGLSLFDEKTKTFKTFKHDPTNTNSLGSNDLIALAIGPDGKLWIGSEADGLTIYDPDSNTFQRYENNPVNNKSLSHNTVRSIYKDSFGNMWLGTYSGGISYKPYYDENFIHLQAIPYNNKSLSSNIVKTITEDSKGNIWIGTENGIDVLDVKTGELTHLKSDPENPNTISDNHINNLASIGRDSMAIGSLKGGFEIIDLRTGKVSHFHKDKSSPSYPNLRVTQIFKDSKGNIWISCHADGFYMFDKNTKSFIHYINDPNSKNSLISNYVSPLEEDKTGNIWVGSDKGVEILDRKKNIFIHIKNDKDANEEINNQLISCFHLDKNGKMWVGTSSSGLFHFNEKDSTFQQIEGLPNHCIHSIQQDRKGFLWITSNFGLSKYDPSTGEIKNFAISDGLQSNEFMTGSGCIARDGKLYFGGTNGLIVFDPDKIIHNKWVPNVVLTNFYLYNKEVPIADGSVLPKHINEVKEIYLSHDQGYIAFEFTALDVVSSDKNEFAYMLEGLDKYWNYVGHSRKATYTNLDPGKYYFKVKASNKDGVWNEKEKGVWVIIAPPFWKTWWFRTIVALVLISGIIVFDRFRLKRMAMQRKILKKQVGERTQELMKQSVHLQQMNNELNAQRETKDKFFSIISHDLRNPVNALNALIKLFKMESTKSGLSYNKEMMHLIEESSEKIQNLVVSLLEWAKTQTGNLQITPENLQVLSLVDNTVGLLKQHAASKNIEIVTTVNAGLTIIADRNMASLVIRNIISNSIKFTPAGGKVVVNAAIASKSEVIISIKDNGVGMEPEVLQKLGKEKAYSTKGTSNEVGTGMGLLICQEFMNLNGGAISIESRPGEGSTFYLSFPAGKNSE